MLTDALRAARSRGPRRRARGHRRPPAHQGQPDGRAGQDGARGRAARCRARRTRRCSCSTPPWARTALAQGREFAKAAGVTGLVLTKLDGTAKGGVAVAVVRELGVPIRYVGVGESVEDLLPFDRRRLRGRARRVESALSDASRGRAAGWRARWSWRARGLGRDQPEPDGRLRDRQGAAAWSARASTAARAGRTPRSLRAARGGRARARGATALRHPRALRAPGAHAALRARAGRARACAAWWRRCATRTRA